MVAVIRSFADETTRDLFGNVNTKAARRVPNTAWKVAQRQLKQLDLMTKLDDLTIPPGNDLHALKGDDRGMRQREARRWPTFRTPGADRGDCWRARY